MRNMLPLFSFLAALLVGVALIAGSVREVAASNHKMEVMPSDHAGGGSVTDAGLHFNDGSLASYDFSHSDGAWIRGWVVATLTYPTRYMYWDEGGCRVRGRLQRHINGVWYDDYYRDIDLLHLNNRPVIHGLHPSNKRHWQLVLQGSGHGIELRYWV